MERLSLNSLENWFNSKLRKPLIVWGARQVGKSHLIEELFLKPKFGKNYLYIDLIKNDEDRTFFSTTTDPKKYLSYIELKYQRKISNDFPLVFDEVQKCPQVLTSLKYFCVDFPEIPIIVTGSLVRISLKEQSDDFLFPVGKVNEMFMFPMTFEEFLINKNSKLYDLIVNSYKTKTALDDIAHSLAIDTLFEYLSLGGMPEVLKTYFETNSFLDAYKVRKDIYNNYIADMDTYNISNENVLKTRAVYKNIYSQLNKENKNFKISYVEKGKSNRDYFNAYQWLILSNVVYKSSKLKEKVPLPLVEDNNSLFRMYLSDVGLFGHQSGINSSYFFNKIAYSNISGIFFENYVACELVAHGIPLFYWCGKNEYEFEFVVENQGIAVPIDVKKKSGSLNSLKEFRNHNKKGLAIKISQNKLGFDKDNLLLTIPLYQVFMLSKDLEENRNILTI